MDMLLNIFEDFDYTIVDNEPDIRIYNLYPLDYSPVKDE